MQQTEVDAVVIGAGFSGLYQVYRCLLYTSDAADDWLVVVLSGVGGA